MVRNLGVESVYRYTDSWGMHQVPRKKNVVPSLLRHAGKKLGFVRLGTKTKYLGAWPDGLDDAPKAVRDNYDRAVAEWLASGRSASPPPRISDKQTTAGDADGCSVAELCLAFLEHAERHYRGADGKPTGEVREYRRVTKLLNELYGGLPAAEFSPLRLKSLRERMVLGGVSRGVINQRVGRVVRCFKFGVGEELVPPAVYLSLKAVPGLQKGRTDARETSPVKPVSPDLVAATLPHCSRVVAGAVRFLSHTGCRPSEALRMRLADLERRPGVWLLKPATHKTLWRGKLRVVAVGPKGQIVVNEFIKIRCPLCGVEGRPPRIGCRDLSLCGPCADRMDEAGVFGPWPRVEVQPPDVPLFSPRVEQQERSEDLRSRRVSRVQPSQQYRRKAKPERKPGDFYSVESFNHAIEKACVRAGVESWAPNRLRHAVATEVRRLHGLEAVQTVLGHSNAAISEIYAERDLALAAKVAEAMG